MLVTCFPLSSGLDGFVLADFMGADFIPELLEVGLRVMEPLIPDDDFVFPESSFSRR